LIIFKVSSANSFGAAASAVSEFAKKPKAAVVNALKSKAFLRVLEEENDDAFATSSFDDDEEEELSTRSRIAEKDLTFCCSFFLVNILVFDGTLCRQQQPRLLFDDRDNEGIIHVAAEKEEDMLKADMMLLMMMCLTGIYVWKKNG
jgi:hypothetical protein